MRNAELTHLLDNLRLYNKTGEEEHLTAALSHIDNLKVYSGKLLEREIKILEMNGFKVVNNYIQTKKGQVPIV